MAVGSISIRDRSDELTVTRLNVADTVTAADLATEAADLFNAGVITGLPIRSGVTVQQVISLAGAIGSNAQRELKWNVTYEDVQEFLDPGTDTVPNPGFGKLYNLELGTANSSALDPGTDILAPTSTEWSAIDTFFQNVPILSPTGGETALRRVRLVGRNI